MLYPNLRKGVWSRKCYSVMNRAVETRPRSVTMSLLQDLEQRHGVGIACMCVFRTHKDKSSLSLPGKMSQSSSRLGDTELNHSKLVVSPRLTVLEQECPGPFLPELSVGTSAPCDLNNLTYISDFASLPQTGDVGGVPLSSVRSLGNFLLYILFLMLASHIAAVL